MIGTDTSTTATNWAQVVNYAVWKLLEERCRRVFDNKTQTPIQVATLIQQDILLYAMAHDPEHVTEPKFSDCICSAVLFLAYSVFFSLLAGNV